VSLSGIFGLLFVLIFFGSLLVSSFVFRQKREFPWRDIAAFKNIQHAIGLAVEDGTTFHFSLGRGLINALESAVTFVGLRMLERITRLIASSDRQPLVTSGEGAVNILSRDTLQATYRDLGMESQYSPSAGLMVGPTPLSYAAGSIPLLLDEKISANVLIGHYGSEVAFFYEAGERAGASTVAGTDHLEGQAVIYAASESPLVGEEVFAGGAYLQAGLLHQSSLQVQDIFRWVVIILLLGGALLKLLNLEQLLLALISGAP
jgi:hypothetical protein